MKKKQITKKASDARIKKTLEFARSIMKKEGDGVVLIGKITTDVKGGQKLEGAAVVNNITEDVLMRILTKHLNIDPITLLATAMVNNK